MFFNFLYSESTDDLRVRTLRRRHPCYDGGPLPGGLGDAAVGVGAGQPAAATRQGVLAHLVVLGGTGRVAGHFPDR